MSKQRITFSPVTRLSGLLSVDVMVDKGKIVEANASGTMFRGYEWLMCGRHVTDGVYMTQRVCGICSLAHGAIASYLLDELYDNELSENAQYLRNIMLAADFIQNHIRHFYVFSLPDFVKMPDYPPFEGQNLKDARLNPEDNKRLVEHYFLAIKAAQQSHQILALFGGKAPHQHSFIHGGVAVAPTVDKMTQAQALITDIGEFVKQCMIPDTELIARVYNDYFKIGVTPRNLLSFGLFKFGAKNEKMLWRSGVLVGDQITQPEAGLIHENISRAWYQEEHDLELKCAKLKPDPYKPEAYTWIKSALYGGGHFEGGPLARMIINGWVNGGTGTMDRIYARSLETLMITKLMEKWLGKLKPGPAPLNQKKIPVKSKVTAMTDAMRGPLFHYAHVEKEEVVQYDIITPTVWNFSPKDQYDNCGPVENALVGTEIPKPDMLYTILGRIIRSFDPCIACATHVLDVKENIKAEVLI